MRVSRVLREVAASKPVIELDLPDGATVGDALDWVLADNPAVGRRVRDEQGAIRRHVNVFVGGDNIRDLDGQGTTLTDGAEIHLVPAVSGG